MTKGIKCTSRSNPIEGEECEHAADDATDDEDDDKGFAGELWCALLVCLMRVNRGKSRVTYWEVGIYGIGHDYVADGCETKTLHAVSESVADPGCFMRDSEAEDENAHGPINAGIARAVILA